MEPEPVKPGFLTTEFWLTLAGQLIAILVLLGVIGKTEEDAVKNALAEAIKHSAALVAAAGMLWKYIQSRAQVKAAVNVAKASENNLKRAVLGGNASRIGAALLVGLVLCGATQAQAPLTVVNVTNLADGTYLLTKKAGTNPTVIPIAVVEPSPNPGPGPGPTPVPVPIGDLTATVKAALASVPEYGDKSQHRRAMAFGMSFLTQATGNVPVANSRVTVKQFCNAACGVDAPKWASWWSAVDAKLDSAALTPATYTAALKEIAAALTADLPPGDPDSAKDFGGTPTYGLNPDFIKFLLEVLLPLLLKLLGVTS